MTRPGTFLSMLLALLVALLAVAGATAHTGHSHDHGTPEAGTPVAGDGAGLSLGAAYLEITNNGEEDDRLVAAETDIAEAVEIHDVTMDGGVMQMSPVERGLRISAGETIELSPGGGHLMLIGLTESLLAGEEFTVTLTFERAGKVELTVPILRSAPDDDAVIEAGDLVIENAWARPAPKLDGTGTPAASPEATPAG